MTKKSITPTPLIPSLLSVRHIGTPEARRPMFWLVVVGSLFVLAMHTSIHAVAVGCLPSTAPDSGVIANGGVWNIARAQKFIVGYSVPFSVVERSSVGVWRQSCELTPQNLATSPSWAGCPPPPPCTQSEAALKRQHGMERLALWKLRCLGKKVTIPDDDPHCSVPVQRIHSIVVHQTETAEAYGPDRLQRAHMSRGYDDIGYHYVIAKTGAGWRIFRGRSESVEGAHAGAGLNEGSISIAIAGDYRAQSNVGKDPATLVPPQQAVGLLGSLVLDIKARHESVTGIYGHGEYKLKGSGCDTDCPSVGIQQLVNALRAAYFVPQGSR